MRFRRRRPGARGQSNRIRQRSRQKTRHIDQTTLDAFEAAKGNLPLTCALIGEALLESPGTVDQVADRIGIHPDNVGPAMTKLRREMRLVRASGRKAKSRRGRWAIVWELGADPLVEDSEPAHPCEGCPYLDVASPEA